MVAVTKDQNKILAQNVKEVAQVLCSSENFELVHVDCVNSNREKIVRVYVDKPGGITIDDCVNISRQLGDLVDVHIEDIGSYRLEVSSPGPNRPLTKKEDFLRFKGERVRIKTFERLNNQKNFIGILKEVNNDSVVIAFDKKEVLIHDEQISKAILAGQ